MTPCSCTCHGRTDYPCSVLGGCGSEGCREGSLVMSGRCTGDPCQHMRPGLCRWHADRLARELAEWPELWTALHEALMPSGGRGDGRGSGEPASGVRWDVLSALGPSGAPSLYAQGYDEAAVAAVADQDGRTPIPETFRGWLRLAAEERAAPVPSWTFQQVREWLVRWHDWIIVQPWSDEYAAELHQAWRTAMTLTDRWQPAEHLNGRYCPWCDSNTLYSRPGADVIECQERAGGCGQTMTREDYDRMCAMRAAHAKQTGAA